MYDFDCPHCEYEHNIEDCLHEDYLNKPGEFKYKCKCCEKQIIIVAEPVICYSAKSKDGGEMIKQLIPAEPQQCPVQMPISYFGASYPDSQCIEGYLWDEDSGDFDGLTSGGDIPCPFCNPEDHANYMKEHDRDEFVCEVCNTKLDKLHWAETDKPSVKLYGYCHKCSCNQWAGYEEPKADAEET